MMGTVKDWASIKGAIMPLCLILRMRGWENFVLQLGEMNSCLSWPAPIL
jgi:hypothetical protein